MSKPQFVDADIDDIRHMRPMVPGAKILVVKENGDIRDYLQCVLSIKWRVEVVDNSEQALSRIIENSPDLVITDMMPENNGLALLREIRANQKITIPVLLLTAQAGEEVVINGLLEGGDDFITSPFEARELIARVGAQLEINRIGHYNRQAILASEQRYRQLNDSLQTSYEQLAMVQRAARMGLWSYDLKGNRGFVTEQWRQLMGYVAEEEPWNFTWNFTKFLTYVNRDDQKQIKAAYWKALNTESGLNIEFRINHAENGEQWMVWRAHYVRPTENKAARLLGYMVNITESKQASQALHLSQERYKCLVMVNAAIVWTTAPDGRFIEDVPMWEAFTGQTFAEYKNYGWLSALHPDDREPTFTLWMDALEIKTPMEALFRLRLRDGKYYEMLSVGIPVFNVDGSIWEWVGTITEVKG